MSGGENSDQQLPTGGRLPRSGRRRLAGVGISVGFALGVGALDWYHRGRTLGVVGASVCLLVGAIFDVVSARIDLRERRVPYFIINTLLSGTYFWCIEVGLSTSTDDPLRRITVLAGVFGLCVSGYWTWRTFRPAPRRNRFVTVSSRDTSER